MSKLCSPNWDPCNRSRLSNRLALALLTSQKQCPFANSNQGLSLVELVVGSIISLIVIGLAFSGAIANRTLFLEDQSRNNVNQNLRSGLDILGADVQQIGEGLGTVSNFPAFQITNNGVGTSSEIIIRRSPLSPLPVCADIVAGTSTPITVGIPGSTLGGCNPGVDNNGNTFPDRDVDLWRNYRLDNIGRGLPTQAFIFDGTDKGEVFGYSQEDRFPNDATGRFRISRTSDSWLRNYGEGRANVYLVEERRYRLCPAAQITQPNCRAVAGADNVLHVIVNGNFTNPIQLINGIDQFNVEVFRQPAVVPASETNPTPDFCWQGGTPVTPVPNAPVACTNTAQTWNQITSVRVTMRALNDAPSDLIRLDPNAARAEDKRVLTRDYFPRNVLTFPAPSPSP
jgi:hypothetical protein